jgi:uncharacterized protein
MKTGIARVDKGRFGPWAVVTGASSGLGRDFANQLAANGINLVLIARRAGVLRALGEDLRARHRVEFRAVGLDLGERGFLDQVAEATKGLDVGRVVSNAGASQPREFLANDLDALHGRLHLNTQAHLDLAHHFGHRLAARGRGGIVLVSAAGSRHGVPNMASDAAAKAYVLVLGKGLHAEFARRGVTVSVLLPGATDTPALDELGFDRGSMPMKPTPSAQVVTEGLTALGANRATHIAGWVNRVMDAVVPGGVTAKVMGRMMGQAAERLAERGGSVNSAR